MGEELCTGGAGLYCDGKSRLKALEKLCIYPEDGLLILSRKLMDGRSVSRINGETVTIAVLKEVAAILIDIHGQHEHQSLLYKKNHLGFVDAFAWDYLADIKNRQLRLIRNIVHVKRLWMRLIWTNQAVQKNWIS